MHPKLVLAWLAISGVGLAAPGGRQRIFSSSWPNSYGIRRGAGVATTVTAVEEALYGDTAVAQRVDGGTTTTVTAVEEALFGATAVARRVGDGTTTVTAAEEALYGDTAVARRIGDGTTTTVTAVEEDLYGATAVAQRIGDGTTTTVSTVYAYAGVPSAQENNRPAQNDSTTTADAGNQAIPEGRSELYGCASLGNSYTRTPNSGGPVGCGAGYREDDDTEPGSSGDGARPDGSHDTETTVPGYSSGPDGRTTSTGGSSSTSARDCSDPPTAFQLSDRPYENFFYTDCNVAAQVVITSPGPEDNLTIIGPRLVVAWPAGNSGAAAFFAPANGVNGTLAVAVDNQTSGGAALDPVHLPPPAGSEYPSVGVSGTLVFNDTAVLTLAILGSESF